MRQVDPHHRGRDSSSSHSSLAAWLPALAAMAIMLTGCVSTFLVLQLDTFRPKIGDIVTFRPGSQDAEMWQMQIPAKKVTLEGPSSGRCILDPNVIAKSGGSFVVESLRQQPSLQYILHWAGHTTAVGSGSCGPTAEVAVSRTNLQRLANAAGGFGVSHAGFSN